MNKLEGEPFSNEHLHRKYAGIMYKYLSEAVFYERRNSALLRLQSEGE